MGALGRSIEVTVQFKPSGHEYPKKRLAALSAKKSGAMAEVSQITCGPPLRLGPPTHQ